MYLYDKNDKFRIFEIKEKKNRYTKMSLICSVYIKFILDKLRWSWIIYHSILSGIWPLSPFCPKNRSSSVMINHLFTYVKPGWRFSPVSSTNKTGHQDITEILWNSEHNQLNPYNWLLDWVLYFYIHNSMCRYTLINYQLTLTSRQSVVRIKLIVFTVPQYFSYILVASFIGGGNRRKPPTGRKSLTYFIT
jgi:hypothetical protein